jgi:hypothetical protein
VPFIDEPLFRFASATRHLRSSVSINFCRKADFSTWSTLAAWTEGRGGVADNPRSVPSTPRRSSRGSRLGLPLRLSTAEAPARQFLVSARSRPCRPADGHRRRCEDAGRKLGQGPSPDGTSCGSWSGSMAVYCQLSPPASVILARRRCGYCAMQVGQVRSERLLEGEFFGSGPRPESNGGEGPRPSAGSSASQPRHPASGLPTLRTSMQSTCSRPGWVPPLSRSRGAGGAPTPHRTHHARGVLEYAESSN